MKTAITCFISLLILQCSAADGAPLRTSELFHLDEQFIANELKELTLLEEYVNENEGLTYCKIIEMKKSFLYEPGCNFHFENLSNDIFNELPMGIPAFFWGFTGGLMGSCTGAVCCVFMIPIGGAVAGLTAVGYVQYETDDQSESLKAALGCVAGNLVGLGLYSIYVVIVGTVFFP